MRSPRCPYCPMPRCVSECRSITGQITARRLWVHCSTLGVRCWRCDNEQCREHQKRPDDECDQSHHLDESRAAASDVGTLRERVRRRCWPRSAAPSVPSAIRPDASGQPLARPWRATRERTCDGTGAGARSPRPLGCLVVATSGPMPLSSIGPRCPSQSDALSAFGCADRARRYRVRAFAV
jgi:hypothetical protein